MSGEYALGVWEQGPDQEGMDITVAAEIGREEFSSYTAAIATYQSLVARPTYQVLTRNHHRLAAMLDTYSNLERIGGLFKNLDLQSVNSMFMGEITNWLASTRLYLESERDFILRQFGDGSDQLRRYQSVTSSAFDTHPGYRFLYDLRNYAQHCGPPLSGLTIAATTGGRTTVDLYLSRSHLLFARFSWSHHARALLEQWPEQISLMPLVDDAMAGLRLVEDEILRVLLQRCGEAVSIMRDGITRAGAVDGHPAVFRLPTSNETGQLAWQTFPETSALDDIEQALATEDPLAAVRPPSSIEPTHSEEQQHADDQAAAVIATWLVHGSGTEVTDAINRVLEQDRSINPLISGLVNLSVTQLTMLERALGAPPEDLLGGFLSRDTE
ncbi:hypothetical protein EF847_14695 [Actinobacteria bacterium YIM 96077]|uniref:Uncharacterized protein n=1 Tax=Phytoactinopolyspora halophila TaxID=1981511 RepID=A0A329QU34_9ACTN|nr:hypothetical protein [Phytoactinopolyspora halophila]AYY13754.1 hypothetical protein EF847_14695 [Actinobacteria bacterium YIM 96077]RAW15703.1 hypothetical protein DPM12_08645 [Phytoactinopolyspora halophila]